MSVRVDDDLMSSDRSRHTATRRPDGWVLPWLPDRFLSRDQAITGMTIAEAVTQMQADNGDHTHRLWPFLDGWAAELGLTGPDAMVRVTEPIEEG